MLWIQVVGSGPLDGVVAEGRDCASGEVVEVQDATARKLVYAGRARLVEPPGPDRPAAEQRRRTR